MKMRLMGVNSAGRTRPGIPQGKGLAFGLLCAFLFLGLFISTAAAETEWKITPSNPTVGDTLKVKGTASPGEKLRAEVSFEMELPVSEEGRYEYLLEKIKVPEDKNNRFTVRAEGVENLNISVNKSVWINQTSEANDEGVVVISQGHVPPSTYLILLSGDALNVPDEEKSSVNLTVTVAQTLKADSKGKFKFDYETTSLPAGLYTIRIGDKEEIIELKPKKPAAAEIEWKITPSNPTVGDTLKVKGTASPGEEFRAEVSFKMELPVSEEGRYEYLLEKIKVPKGKDNRFTVRAEEVENLNVSVKKLIWLNLTSEANDEGVAAISQGHVPPFTYLILLSGDALNVPAEENSSVNLTVTAAQTLKADSKGKFKFDYDTTSLPAGLYTIKIGDKEEIIELKPEKPAAAFSACPVSGKIPLKVQFFDRSTGSPTSWKWNFGDGKISTLQDPKHTYCKAGKYHVSLTVSNAGGNDTLTKCSYITVNATA